MLGKLTSADFAPYQKQTFRIYFTPTQSIEAELIQVKELPGGYDDLDDEEEAPPRRQPFSLIFRSAQVKDYLPQKIYTVQHEQLGSLDIFLVPIGPDSKGMRYQAIFT
jgi:hypothetical protein